MEVLHRRLQKLHEYLEVLEQLKRYSLEEFVTDPERYGSAERFLQLAIDALNDMGSHVIADLGLGAIKVASDIPKILRGAGYIEEEMMGRWTRMNGFRKILVHDYLQIDRELVYRVLQGNLNDLRSLQRVFALFL